MRKTLLAALLLLPLAAQAQDFIRYYSPGGTTFTGGTMTTPVLGIAADSCSAIPFSFVSDTNTGLCSTAADTWNLYTAGASRLSGNSTAVTSTVPYYASDGLVTAPSYAWTSEANSEFYRAGAGNIGFSILGVRKLVFSASVFGFDNSHVLQWYTSGFAGAGLVLVYEFATPGTLQLRSDANGAAVPQTIKAHDGITGTDNAGANFTLAGGRGTGAGAPGNVILQTATALGTGTTAQTLTDRVTVSLNGIAFSKWSTENEGSIFRISCA